MALRQEHAYLYYINEKNELKTLSSPLVENQEIFLPDGSASWAKSYVFTPDENYFIVAFFVGMDYWPVSNFSMNFSSGSNEKFVYYNDITPLELFCMHRSEGLDYTVIQKEYREANKPYKMWVPYVT